MVAVPTAAVGAVGVPVKAGLANGAFKITEFNSAAEAVTRVPPSFKPPSTKSCDAMSKVWSPSVAPTTIVPEASCVTALLSSDVPSVVMSR